MWRIFLIFSCLPMIKYRKQEPYRDGCDNQVKDPVENGPACNLFLKELSHRFSLREKEYL